MFTAVRRHFSRSVRRCISRICSHGFPAPVILAMPFILALVGCGSSGSSSADQVAEGKQTFRYETFGDETKWTDTLHLDQVISTVDPTTALSVGLKVDSEALPPAVVNGIQNGSISLTDPATTIALLKLDAVLGVNATVSTVNGKDTLTRVGITCALCHSTVDNSFAQGVGKRLVLQPEQLTKAGHMQQRRERRKQADSAEDIAGTAPPVQDAAGRGSVCRRCVEAVPGVDDDHESAGNIGETDCAHRRLPRSRVEGASLVLF